MLSVFMRIAWKCKICALLFLLLLAILSALLPLSHFILTKNKLVETGFTTSEDRETKQKYRVKGDSFCDITFRCNVVSRRRFKEIWSDSNFFSFKTFYFEYHYCTSKNVSSCPRVY